jgi:hypothetical protein
VKGTPYVVEAKGVGRKDYSGGTAVTVEPVISDWQSVYLHRDKVTVPALSSLVVNVSISTDIVVVLYDFFASVPSNLLIGMDFAVNDMAGILTVLFETQAYQTIQKHMSKGFPSFSLIQYTLYNYADTDQEFRIGCAGISCSLQAYYLKLPEEIALP